MLNIQNTHTHMFIYTHRHIGIKLSFRRVGAKFEVLVPNPNRYIDPEPIIEEDDGLGKDFDQAVQVCMHVCMYISVIYKCHRYIDPEPIIEEVDGLGKDFDQAVQVCMYVCMYVYGRYIPRASTMYVCMYVCMYITILSTRKHSY